MKNLFGFIVLALLLSSCNAYWSNGKLYKYNADKYKYESQQTDEKKTKEFTAERVEERSVEQTTTDVAPEQLNYRPQPEFSASVNNDDKALAIDDTPVILRKMQSDADPDSQLTDVLESENKADDDVEFVLLFVLAILLPPLAVYLVEELSSRFWITLILCLLGGGGIFSPYAYVGLLWLIAIVIAILTIMGR